MKHSITAALAIMMMACGASSDTGVNKSIFVGDGEHEQGSLRSVNGSINVGNGARVEGKLSTVNGAIVVGENSEVGEISCVNGEIFVDRNSSSEEISCVNGSISIGSEVTIEGDLSTVNGPIKTKLGTKIYGDIGTVNGEIHIQETLVAHDVRTVNGHIDLLESSLIKGDVIVDRERRKPFPKAYGELLITISGSTVEGNIEVKGDDPNVTVVLSDGGEVTGEIKNARVVRK
ncbi:MAG: hypothetical protein K9N38_09175 [Candidatus Marinimicrobia bacterium]|nr:hypothetical protein [Candidatus Neomarinimicrobiota bacterium]MCF7851338.1 hypothetical protein [Candidatus Neomarinimicrobiota bacterium]